MHDDIRPDIVGRLTRDYGFRESGDYLRRGKCPTCAQKELFVSAKNPWVVKCGRVNKCGWSASVRDLYPDAFARMNERFPPTTEQPNATADAYLSFVRHLDITGIRNWYRQGSFRHPHGNRTTATVVFDVAPGVWMERLIEPVTITLENEEPELRKANFVGKHGGLWWQPPDLEIADGEELWLVEGCIDAISLRSAGIKAVATLSSSNYPKKALDDLIAKGIRPILVWAMDNDHAGRRAIEKGVELARKAGFSCRAALIPQPGSRKVDWNDALADEKLGKEHFDLYRYHGDLLLAPTVLEKGLLFWRRTRQVTFSIEFDSRTWWWELPVPTFAATLELVAKEGIWGSEQEVRWEAAKRTAVVSEIANVTFRFLYFQKSQLTDESWYYARISFPHGRHEIKDTFTGAQVATASEFKKRLLSVAPGALFTGATWQLNWIIKNHLDQIKIVDTVDFIGYSKQHKAWIFPSAAVSAGKVHPINDEDFFEIGRHSAKSLNHSIKLEIGRKSDYRPDWYELVYKSFGPKGLVAAAFFLGSLFAEQIREMHKSYPFLEIVGDAGSGKTTLIEFLWKLVGRNDYEGFDPNKSTLAARARIMSQVSNLPVSFIESDRSGDDTIKQKQFDWDELKTAYNGRASRATGIANGSNDTKETPFRGSVLISQNAPVAASDAIMQRITHLRFTTAGHTRNSKIAADTLAALPVEAVSHFLIQATTAEARILRTVGERAPHHEAELLRDPRIRSIRIAKNHSQLMALVEALGELLEMPADWVVETLAVVGTAAHLRQDAIASDSTVVEEFWDLCEFLGWDKVSHCSPIDGEIALNLNHVASLASKAGLTMPLMKELKQQLRGSRSRPFQGIRTQRSVQAGFDTVRCWFFKDLVKKENDDG